MRDSLPTGELRLSNLNVFDQLGPLDEPLIFLDIQEHCSPTAMLSQDQWAASLLHLTNELGRVGSKLRKRAYIAADPD